MMTTRALIVYSLALAAMGASASAQDAPPACQPGPGQAFVGGPATQITGAQILSATKARIFQWVFEGSPVTMDFRPDRVRVVYNRDMNVVAVTCG
ncbi:MAG: I78 family peptidase inhibitor [Pseudomonadota bacterium]